MTLEEAGRLVTILLAAYPAARERVDRHTITVYAHMLADLDFETARAAALKCMAQSTFFPSVAEIRRAAAEIKAGIPTAEEAWAEVRREIGRVGTYAQPAFSHPLIAEAARAIGWWNLCMSESPGVERGHFLRVYETLRNRELERIQLTPELQQLVGRLAGALGPGAPERALGPGSDAA